MNNDIKDMIKALSKARGLSTLEIAKLLFPKDKKPYDSMVYHLRNGGLKTEVAQRLADIAGITLSELHGCWRTALGKSLVFTFHKDGVRAFYNARTRLTIVTSSGVELDRFTLEEGVKLSEFLSKIKQHESRS